MSEDTNNASKPKRSVVRKTLTVIWRIYYDLTIVVGIMVFLFVGWAWHNGNGFRRPSAVFNKFETQTPPLVVLTDMGSESSSLSDDKLSGQFEQFDDEIGNSTPQDDVSVTVVP